MGRAAIIRFIVANAMFGLPFGLLLVLLVAGDRMGGGVALVCWLFAQGLVATIAWPYFEAINAVLGRFGDRFGRSYADAPAERFFGPTDIVRIIDRQREALDEERANLRGQASTADAVLEALNDPVVVIDERRRVLRINAMGRRLFGDPGQGSDLALVVRQPNVLALVDRRFAGQSAADEVAEFAMAGPPVSYWVALVTAFPEGQTGAARAILTLHDITSLRRAEQMRADFVANASHELRTPLSSLLGFIETLRGPARDDAPARERFLAIMHEQASRMARLVADLLSLSQIELAEHTPPQGEVDLLAVARVVASALEPQVKERGISVEIEQQGSPGLAIGDADQLAQVIQNLLDNAVKYSPTNGRVRVIAERAPGANEIALSISDEGEGIAREHLPRLTERFYRVDSARSRALGGTGLGLAIVKHIISRHRGSLNIASESGKGSTFTIRIPAVIQK